MRIQVVILLILSSILVVHVSCSVRKNLPLRSVYEVTVNVAVMDRVNRVIEVFSEQGCGKLFVSGLFLVRGHFPISRDSAMTRKRFTDLAGVTEVTIEMKMEVQQ